MSKGLEALKEIRDKVGNKVLFCAWNDKGSGYSKKITISDYCDIIETELKRLENYEKNEDFNKDVLSYAFLNEQDKIKKLKALDIIKEHWTYNDKGLVQIKPISMENANLLKELLL